MPNHCAVKNCRATHTTFGGKTIRTHYFPKPKLPTLRKEWAEFCERPDFVPTKHSVICCRHFQRSDYIIFGKKGKLKQEKLKSFAKPSLFPPTPKEDSVAHDHGVFVQQFNDHDFDVDDSYGHQHKEIGAECEIAITHEEQNADLKSENEALKAELEQFKLKAQQDKEVQDEAFKAELEQCKVQAEKEKEALKTQIDEWVLKVEQEQKEKQELNDAISRVYNPDEVYRLKNPKSRKEWSMPTLKKHIQTYYSCGGTAYEHLRDEQNQPLASSRTLRNHMAKIDFEPGTLDEIIEKMRAKVQNMHPNERGIGILQDEIMLEAQREFDSAQGSFIGHCTLLPPEKTIEYRKSKGEDQMDRLASHALAVIIVGLSTRFKQLIGYHFTDSSFDAKKAKEWFVELITKLQNIGFKVYFITMDMGPNNQAL